MNEIVKRLKDRRTQEFINESVHLNEDEGDQRYEEFKKLCMENPTWQKAAKICKRWHYVLSPLSYVSNTGRPYVGIQADKNGSALYGRYLPEVSYASGSVSSHKDYKFLIQTTSYGALDIKEHGAFVAAVRAAQNMLIEFDEEGIDFTTLYREEDDGEE